MPHPPSPQPRLGHRAVFFTVLLLASLPFARSASDPAQPPLTMPAAMAAAETAPKTSVRDLLALEEGGGDAVIASLVFQVNTASVAEARVLESEFMAVIETPGASFSVRQFSCRMLQSIGTARSVPVLTQLLGDPQLSHAARLALEAIPGKQSLAALRRALAAASGATRLGLIDSLGARGDTASVPVLATLAQGQDESAALGALKALARIGGPKATRALAKLKVPEQRRAAVAHARLACAETLPAGEAAIIYRSLDQAGAAPQIRIAAFLGLIRCEPPAARERLMAALKSGDPVQLSAVQAALFEWADGKGIEALAGELPALPASGKIAFLRGLAGRSSVAARAALLNPLFADADADVRLTAMSVADLMGDASSVVPLVGALAADDEGARAALRSLENLQGDGVVEEIMRLSGTGDPKVRVSLITVLTDRQTEAAVSRFHEFLDDPNPRVRQAAIKALGRLAPVGDATILIDLLLAGMHPGDRQALALAAAAIARRNDSMDGRSAPFIRALHAADAEAKAILIEALGGLGGEKAYAAVGSFLESPLPELRRSALRAFGEWPDAGPMQDLAKIAQMDDNPSNRILALRAHIRCIGLPKNMPVAERIALYRTAMGMAARPEEKWLVLAGLAEVSNLGSLSLVEGALDDPALKTEAVQAYAKIATSLARSHPSEARAALQRVLRETEDRTVLRRTRTTLDTLK